MAYGWVSASASSNALDSLARSRLRSSSPSSTVIDIAETQESQRERGPVAVDDNGSDEQHPAWCSREHCFVTDQGVVLHQQAPIRWEDGRAEVRCESRLLDPADDEHTYVELSLENLRLKWLRYHGILPVEVARRLRDQLTEHLDAVE